jgi:hypothetical protein
MKKLIPLFVLGTVASTNAQVVIDQADFPVAGETITFGDDADVSNLTLDLGSTGGGQTFDLSNLETDELFDVGFYAPGSVTGGSDFPTADLAVDQVGGIFAFAEVGAGSVDIIGLGGDFAGQLGSPIPIVVSLEAQDPWTLFEFPSSVSSPVLMDTAHFEGKFYSDGLVPAQFASFWDPDSVQVKRVVYYEAEVVGDGTLTDPLGGTHNVLKMEVVETNIDTIWGWTASDGWERPPSFVEGLIGVPSNETVYRTRFISKELGYYVVDVTTESNGTPISATFKSDQSECCTGVEEIVAAGQNVLYPNPTNDVVRVRTGGDIYEFNVYDMTGKFLVSELLTMDQQAVNLEGLSTGLYIFQMVDEAGKVAHTSRLSVVK